MTPAARHATLDDVPVLVDLMREFYAEAALALERQEATDTFVRLLQDPARGSVWLLEASDEYAG